jgi:hypothetical protein
VLGKSENLEKRWENRQAKKDEFEEEKLKMEMATEARVIYKQKDFVDRKVNLDPLIARKK